jgi:predicted nucleic acid-binding protein
LKAAVVIDASIASAWCFPDEQTDYTQSVLRAVSGSIDALAPRLWAYEVRNGVLMGVRRGRIPLSHAERFLALLSGLCVGLIDPHSYDAIFAVAERHGLTVYDAAYLDLALREGLPLASLDARLRKAAAKCGVLLFEPQE